MLVGRVWLCVHGCSARSVVGYFWGGSFAFGDGGEFEGIVFEVGLQMSGRR